VIRSPKGYILVFVILVCAALLMLGTSLPELNSVDLKIAANQRDSVQAYYLAATGIETAFGILEEYNPFYCGSGEMSLAGGSISVNVNYTDQEDGSRQVQIISVGQKGPIQEKVSVKFESVPSYPEGTDGAELGWYDEISGEIIPGVEHTGDGVVSLGHPDMTSPITLCSPESSGAFLSAEQIFFQSLPVSLLVAETLEISAGIVVFLGSVFLCPEEGSLLFSPPSGDPVRVYFREEVLSTFDYHSLLEPGVYSFPDDWQITGNSSPQETRCYRVLPIVPGTMTLGSGR